jgi:hypothetical protein
MEDKNDIVRIIESESNEIETKMLWFQFPTENDLKALFLPKLENIGFILVDNTITINLKNPTFREQFNDWTERFIEKIDSNDTSEILIEKFNNEIKAIVLLGQKEKKLSVTSAKGLYGELLVLKSHLDEEKYSQDQILEGWHRPAPANHDFDYKDYTLEVKTVSRSNTTFKVTSEDQLTAIEEKPLNLQLYRIENVNKSQIDSLGLLYNEITEKLQPGLVNVFHIKCAEDAFCEYLGPQHMPLDYKFTIIEDFLYVVDQNGFPRIRKDNLDLGISKVSYNLDISAIDNFKIP